MEKRRVLLVCPQNLFGESIEAVLRAADDVEIFGPWNITGDVCQRIPKVHPNVIVIADESAHNEAAASLVAAILEQFPELSVIRAGLSENVFRIFSTQTMPARGTDLLETIRSLPTRS